MITETSYGFAKGIWERKKWKQTDIPIVFTKKDNITH